MNYNQWDIILVPFLFTDLSATKKRPALIISPDRYNSKSDVIIAFITSKLALNDRSGDYHIQDWKESNLPRPSMIRMKIATIDKKIIIKKLGHLTEKDRNGFRKELINFFTN